MEEKEKDIQKTKTIEEKVMERQANNLLNFIIAKTYARQAKMTEEEFLKDIGFEGSGKTEDEAVRIAFLNVLTETTKQLIQAKQSFRNASALMKLYLTDDEKGE